MMHNKIYANSSAQIPRPNRNIKNIYYNFCNLIFFSKKPIKLEENMAAKNQYNTLRILIIDDSPTIRLLVTDVLKFPEYEVIEAENTEIGKEKLASNDIDLILLDICMPGESGLSLLSFLRKDNRYQMLPIIMLTVVDEIQDLIHALGVGATDYITKPFDPLELKARVHVHAERKRLTDYYVDIRTALLGLSKFVESKDLNGKNHSKRCGLIIQAFAQHLNLTLREIEFLHYGALLHDIGKLAIADDIILKPGELTKEERKIVEQHCKIGEEICAPLRSFKPVIDVIRHHHEHWDGTGYPDGLKKEEISFFARMFQIVDVYEALTTQQNYRPAYSKSEAIEILSAEATNNWRDPELTTAFIEMISKEDDRRFK